ncbi:MAG: hypothetical protein ACRDBO_18995 [Lachnospiraceae bacterium]
MRMLDNKAFQEIDTWMNQNARPMELALWNYDWKSGSKDAVVQALAYYQNPDGGFSNALEPDSWNPESSPYATLIALGSLRKIGFVENAGTSHPMIQGIFQFLASGKHSDENGWHFSIPSNDDYAHAPWWTYDVEVNKIQDMGITAGLCSFVLQFGERGTDVYQKASDYVRAMINKVMQVEEFGEMGAIGIYGLLGVIVQCNLTSEYPCEGLKERVEAAINKTIERDSEQWKNYTPRPSQFIDAPSHPLYPDNQEIVEQELEYLLDTRNPGAVWNITWCWFDLQEQYAREFAISENWWMAIKAIEKMEFLRSFGRINS